MLVATLAGGTASSRLDAQEATPSVRRGSYATRPELEALAAKAEQGARNPAFSAEGREFHRGEAWLIRRRLDEGDFVPGDRIVLEVAGETALTDTFIVRPGPELQAGELPPVSLRGVLRSELEAHLSSELRRYFHNPQVRVVPLVRMAVLGQVSRPGYYYVRADILLSEVLMLAGGPGNEIDFKRSEIRRGGQDLHSGGDVRIALADGMSLDALSVRSGDEFFLEQRRQLNWMSILQTVSLASGLITLFVSLTN